MAGAKLVENMELEEKSLDDLKTKYKEIFSGEEPPSNNKTFLWRKIAYKLQEQEYGILSAKAQDRLKALIEEFDPINNKALRPNTPALVLPESAKDKRLPIPGTVITKEYKDAKHRIKVLEKGFEYNAKIYKTLSAIAKEITGAHWNGYLFFSL